MHSSQMKNITQHVCTLHFKDTSGLPKLPPNACLAKRILRKLRKWFLLNPGNIKVKKSFRNKSSMLAERKKHACGPYSFVFHPLSTFSTITEVLFCLTWMYCLVCDPLVVFADNFSFTFVLFQSKVMPILRLMVIVLFFNLGYIDQRTKLCIVDRKKIMFRYLKTYFFFDIYSILSLNIATVLTDLRVIECTYEYDRKSNCYGLVYFTSVLASCARINNLFESLDNVLATVNITTQARCAFIYAVRTFFYVHLFAFMIYFIPFTEFKGKWPENSWLTQAKVDHGAEFYRQYFECFIITLCYFFGISYRFEIRESTEQLCISIVQVSGRLYTLYLIADILNVFGVVGISESMYERQMLSLEHYMREKELPDSLRQRIVHYFDFKFQRRYFRENEILATLSDHLRNDLYLYKARKLVQKVDFFKRLPSTTLGLIIATMKSETFSTNDIIVKIKSNIDDIYFISTGTAALINGNGIEICHLEDGDEFGGTCIIMKEQLFAVVAVETTEVFYINKNKFLEFLKPHSEALILFHQSIKQKLVKYKDLEDKVLNPNDVSLLKELRHGHILEQRTKKWRAV